MYRIACALALALMFAMAAPAAAQDKDKQQGPPPTLVVTAKTEAGVAVPRTDFVGTVYFPEVSEVAAEVGGRVLAVNFEEGRRVRAGQALLSLDTDLLAKQLAAAEATLQEALAALELARIEFERRKTLIESRSISEQEFDESRYTVRELESRAAAARAQAERLNLELAKAAVRAPFSGVALTRQVERGEWISAGSAVAMIGRDDAVDIVVDVPQDALPFVRQGQKVEATVSGKRLSGEVHAVIPKGDVATRTFPVKIRVAGASGLSEGMEAVAHLPSGVETEAVRVPRDAVAMMRGDTVVFTPAEGKAQLIPVQVVAYEGLDAWVNGPGLSGGMDVVVKGKERLFPGAPIRTGK